MPKKFDRSAVMRDAHRRWNYARSKGWHRSYARDRWTWGRCLTLAWAAAKQQREYKALPRADYRRERPSKLDAAIAAKQLERRLSCSLSHS